MTAQVLPLIPSEGQVTVGILTIAVVFSSVTLG